MDKPSAGLYIGLMSGTSADGIDASLIETDGEDYFIPITDIFLAYSSTFQNQLKKLMAGSQDFLEIELELTRMHVHAVEELLEKASSINKTDIVACGFHGQTILHRPEQGICWQIGNPHILAQSTQLNVVYDFRRRDIARGGQGAPLIPIFHECLMRNAGDLPAAMVNIGGVANITYSDGDHLIAFDTGPGNALIDDAMNKYFSCKFDQNGEIALSGVVDKKILEEMLSDEYFVKNYPKSLDRNHFNYCVEQFANSLPSDIIATLSEFTVQSILTAMKLLPRYPKVLYVCGGGAHNNYIMSRLYKEMQILGISLFDEEEKKIFQPDFIESQGFAYLAARHIKGLPSSFPETTGVNQPTICGTFVMSV